MNDLFRLFSLAILPLLIEEVAFLYIAISSSGIMTLLFFGRLRLLGEAEKVFATSHFADKMKYKLEAAVTLSSDWALAADYIYQQNYGHDLEEAMISLRYYF